MTDASGLSACVRATKARPEYVTSAGCVDAKSAVQSLRESTVVMRRKILVASVAKDATGRGGGSSRLASLVIDQACTDQACTAGDRSDLHRSDLHRSDLHRW